MLMLGTVSARTKQTPPFEWFSFYHALSTLLIASLALAFTLVYPSSQNYWLMLSSILLSQVGLRNELSWNTHWHSLYYLFCSFITAALVWLLSICAIPFYLEALLLFGTTFLSSYLAYRYRKFFLAAFLTNILLILALFSPTDGETALLRSELLILSGILVTSIRFLFFALQRQQQTELAWKIFLQKLKQVYRLILLPSQRSDEQNEIRFQAAWSDCLSALQHFKRIAASQGKALNIQEANDKLERIWEITLSLGSLRYRMTDKALLSTSQQELTAIAVALAQLLDQFKTLQPKKIEAFNFQAFESSIQRLEELYQSMLQTVAPDPLVLLLFIQDLQALKEELEHFALYAYSPIIKEESPVIPSTAKDLIPARSFILHRSFRFSLAVGFAFLASHFFLNTDSFWAVIMALLLTQSELGAPLHQSIQRCLWMIIILILSLQAMSLLPLSYLPPLTLALAALTAYSYAYYLRRNVALPFSLFLMMTLVLALEVPASLTPAPYFLDVLLGAALAFAATLVIFPDKPDLEFQKRVLPLLKDLSGYLAALMTLVMREVEPTQESLAAERSAIETIWSRRDDYFPVWVFEPGYNPALRPGHYYVLVHLGQISEILFAMNHFARHSFPPELLARFEPALRECAQRNQELFATIISQMKGEKIKSIPRDYIDDVNALEEHFRSTINISIELLDISRDYVYLAAFIRYLKDLRLQLLQIASTLR